MFYLLFSRGKLTLCVRLSTRPGHSLEDDCVVLFLCLKVLVKVSGLGDGAVQGRGGKRPEWGRGLDWVLPLCVLEAFGSPPLTLPFSAFLKIPCVPAAVAADLNKSSGNANGQVLLATGASPRRACGAEENWPGAEMPWWLR